MASIYLNLLKTWCDGLIAHQVKGMGDDFDGAFLCPACKYEHGRCMDAVYPFLYMADRTGDTQYIEAAKAVFDWHARWAMNDDGSAFNDPNSDWKGITVFAATALCEALTHHSKLLDEATFDKWHAQLDHMAEWLYANIDENYRSNINYVATNAAAMALCGVYLDNNDYKLRADRLMRFVLQHFTSSGLLWGEGHDREAVTPHGCRSIDIGYNVEESVPSLVKCALALGDEKALDELTVILKKQLSFMLPDGAWDNTFGTRSNKWTYYGSRTSDGCASAYALLANRDALFPEAAKRNLMLMSECTKDGLLYGGVQYWQHGERPCVHHTFTHANALTVALAAGIEKYRENTDLPCDEGSPNAVFYPELRTYKVSCGPWRATVTGYDALIEAGHATGGTMSLLWHWECGPVIAGAVVDYKLVEPHNQQLSHKVSEHRTLVPRGEVWQDGVRYATCYDTAPVMECARDDASKVITIKVQSTVVNLQQKQLSNPVSLNLTYSFEGSTVKLVGHFTGDYSKVKYILPVIPDEVKPIIVGKVTTERIFFLTGGFEATEYTVAPDENGCFSITFNEPEKR